MWIFFRRSLRSPRELSFLVPAKGRAVTSVSSVVYSIRQGKAARTRNPSTLALQDSPKLSSNVA